ncbi:uncharacterized protein [Apostichopus japonicus]|uniref:uncharacterized protein isoform X2 n=1 Tax=Stichopus japonicus TaxID=307972 RepID=UPI003AB8EACD
MTDQQPPPYDNKSGIPPQQGYPPQQRYPPQQGYPPQQQPQQITVVNTVAAATQPAPVTIVRTTQVQPNDYLVFAILVTIFCFWPTGIVAIVFAAKVRSLFSSGDIQGAEQASASAKLWSKISLGIGIVWITVYVIIQIINIIVGAATTAATISAFDY